MATKKPSKADQAAVERFLDPHRIRKSREDYERRVRSGQIHRDREAVVAQTNKELKDISRQANERLERMLPTWRNWGI